MSEPLTDRGRKRLRRMANALKPVVMIADRGLSDTVLEEVESALTAHELIKVQVRVGARDARDGLISELCERSGAMLVQRIGNVAVLFRRHPDESRIEV